jgi:ornithine decarboxylase
MLTTAMPGLTDGALRSALAAAGEDRIVFDLTGIERRYAALLDELPGVAVRFALKACPVDEVLDALARKGSGVDAASLEEIEQALRCGVPPGAIHYGNTIKSDADIARAYRLGIRDFATDSREDVAAIAEHAPGSRVFCRLATDGGGALWGLTGKFGCTVPDAVQVLEQARAAGLEPAGLSVHVGSQQMTAGAWCRAFDLLTEGIGELRARGIALRYLDLGGGLPALGYLDRRGEPLDPPLDKMFAVIREGMQRCREAAGRPLDFVVEPGRHLVADHGAVRAHVARLTVRSTASGEPERWLYLSCGKFNGLYEMDALQYRLVFPGHDPDGPQVPVTVAGPTCDSDDAYASGHRPVRVPAGLASGDPVWVLSSGAYAVSYMTQGFNGFRPLPWTCVRDDEEAADRADGAGGDEDGGA